MLTTRNEPKWTRDEQHEWGVRMCMCVWVSVYLQHERHIVTVCFVQINFTHAVLVLMSSDGLQTWCLFFIPQQQPRKMRMKICFLRLFADPLNPLNPLNSLTRMHTLTYLRKRCTSSSPLLNLHHWGCRGTWQGLPPLHMWYHEWLPRLLKEDEPLVQALKHSPQKNLHSDDKHIVGWYIN